MFSLYMHICCVYVYVKGLAAQSSHRMTARVTIRPSLPGMTYFGILCSTQSFCVFMSWETQPRAACMPHGQHTTLTACNDIFWSILCPTQIFASFDLYVNGGWSPRGNTLIVSKVA